MTTSTQRAAGGAITLTHMLQNEFVFPFEKLDVWNLAVALADTVMQELETATNQKHYRLVSQMEAAVASVGQNIAEGRRRQHKKEFIQFLYIAEGFPV